MSRAHLPLLLALTLAGALAATRLEAAGTTWQEAIARLAGERTQAETCARVLKKYADPATIDRAALTYGDAKAEYDGVIAGLVVALAQRDKPASLPDLQTRLQRGFEKREAFCNDARSRLPNTAGEKGIIDQIVTAALKPLIDAIVQIYKERENRAELARKTIQTQLEATAWPAFASITSSP